MGLGGPTTGAKWILPAAESSTHPPAGWGFLGPASASWNEQTDESLNLQIALLRLAVVPSERRAGARVSIHALDSFLN